MASTIAAGTTAGTAIAISGDTSGALQLQTNGTTTAVTIDTSQNVGIGTALPRRALSINGGFAFQAAGGANRSIHWGDETTNIFPITIAGNAQSGSESLTFQTNVFGSSGTERMRIDSSGNVGIGTSSSAARLGVVNDQAALSYLFDTSNVTNGGSSLWRMITRNIANTGTTSVDFYKPSGTGFSIINNDTNASNFTAFNVGSSERMRIDSSGNLFIGTTTNPVSNATAIINAVVSSGDGFNLKHTVNGNNMFNLWQTGTTTYTAIGFSKGDSQTVIGTISVSTSAVAYNTTSDYRLKENIVPMVGALETVTKLKPVTYKWKVDGSDGQGFIAHELAAVVPGCVTGEKDATREEEYEVTPAVPAVVDAEGVETTPAVQAVKGTRTVPSYQGVDTSFLVATLTAAIQEAHALIIQLQADVAALKELSA